MATRNEAAAMEKVRIVVQEIAFCHFTNSGLDAHVSRLIGSLVNAMRGHGAESKPARECLIVNVNFFDWLRDGVRQSVLLGVSDAIEQIGSPADSEEIHPGVAAFLHSEKTDKPRVAATSTGGTTASGGSRKRLGRSLKDIDQSASAPT